MKPRPRNVNDGRTRSCKCGAWIHEGCADICEACEDEMYRRQEVLAECPRGCVAIWDER